MTAGTGFTKGKRADGRWAVTCDDCGAGVSAREPGDADLGAWASRHRFTCPAASAGTVSDDEADFVLGLLEGPIAAGIEQAQLAAERRVLAEAVMHVKAKYEREGGAVPTSSMAAGRKTGRTEALREVLDFLNSGLVNTTDALLEHRRANGRIG